jgi:hypothetical protein
MLDFTLRPWHLLVLFLASQLNREQQRIIEYLQVENQVSGGRIRTVDLVPDLGVPAPTRAGFVHNWRASTL